MTLLTVQPPFKGIDRESAPDSIAQGFCRDMQNLLPGRSDRAVVRGGSVQRTSIGSMPNMTFLGAWTYKDTWAIHRGTSGGTSLGLFTSTAETVAAPATSQLGRSYAEMDGYTVGTTPGYLGCWVITSGTDTFALATGGPVGSVAVASHQSRVFALGGSVPGTTTPILNNRLYWTDPGVVLPTSPALAQWQDDVALTTNQLSLPPNDTYVGLVAVNRVLYIIGRRGILALYGDTPATYSLRKVSDLGGCGANAVSPLAAGGGFYFFSNDGLAKYEDGVTRIVSTPVADLVQRVGAGGGSTVYAAIEALGEGYYSVLLPNAAAASGSDWLVYHEPSGAWGRLAMTGTADPVIVRRSEDHIYGFVPALGADPNGYVLDLTYIARPEHPLAATVDSAAGSGIVAYAKSGVQRLATPGRKATLRRVNAEAWSKPNAGAWSLQTLDANWSAAVAPTVTVPANAGGLGTPEYAGTDIFTELDRLTLAWTYTGPAASGTPGAWCGPVWIDYEAAQQR